jgi:putative DNA primase/helicase
MASLPDPSPSPGAGRSQGARPAYPQRLPPERQGPVLGRQRHHRLIAGPFAVWRLTRDRHNEAWGVLLEWRTTMDARTAWPWPAPHWQATAASAPGPAGQGFACQCQHPRTQCPASLSDTGNNHRPRPRRFEGGLARRLLCPARSHDCPRWRRSGGLSGPGPGRTRLPEAGTLEGWKSEVAAPPLATAALPLPCARAGRAIAGMGGPKAAGFICVGHRPSANPRA